ncbi:MAG: hypothetical protein WCF84_09935 [Anaerolineae bacterium]
MKITYIIVALVLIIIAGAGGFYGGMVYAQSQTPAAAANTFLQQRAAGQNGGTGQPAAQLGPCGFPQRQGGGNFQGRQGGQGGQGTPGAQGGQTGQGNNPTAQFGNCVARGQITAIDQQAGTMEVTTAVSKVTVKLVTGKTTISKTDIGVISDLKTGDRVTVFSTETGDSPTASMIQLQNPAAPAGQ